MFLKTDWYLGGRFGPERKYLAPPPQKKKIPWFAVKCRPKPRPGKVPKKVLRQVPKEVLRVPRLLHNFTKARGLEHVFLHFPRLPVSGRHFPKHLFRHFSRSGLQHQGVEPFSGPPPVALSCRQGAWGGVVAAGWWKVSRHFWVPKTDRTTGGSQLQSHQSRYTVQLSKPSE